MPGKAGTSAVGLDTTVLLVDRGLAPAGRVPTRPNVHVATHPTIKHQEQLRVTQHLTARSSSSGTGRSASRLLCHWPEKPARPPRRRRSCASCAKRGTR